MINIGLIGAGYWGKNYIKTLRVLENAKLSWVYNKHREIPRNELPENCKFTKNYQDILKDKELGAVIIATPQETHYPIAEDCLKAGKDVLVEKPMASSSKESLELINLAEENSRILMVGHIFLYHPTVLELKSLLERGILGEIRYFNSRRAGTNLTRPDKNAMWNLAPHDISMINFLSGKLPEKIIAKGVSYSGKESQDAVDLSLDYRNFSASIHVSWIEPKKIRETSVVGSKKRAVFDDMANDKLKIFDSSNPENFYSSKLEDTSSLEKQCIQFLKSIRTRKQPLTNGQNGYEVVRILECAQESLETGEEIEIKF